MEQGKNIKSAMIALMLVLFIDGMGQGIIFPILTDTISNPHNQIILHNASAHVREIWYGILIGVYYLMWFLGASVLGDWSDSVGRKKSLLLCLGLAAISFILCAISYSIGSIILLLVGRFLGGLTSGDQAIAQASVIDLCDPTKKAVFLGLVLLSVTLGLVIGPLIGAFLENPNYVSWFNAQVPFYFTAILAGLNIVMLQLAFKETHATGKSQSIRWARAITLFAEAFTHKKVRLLLIAYTLIQAGWSMVYVFSPDYLTTAFHLSSTKIGWYLALVGAGLGLGLGLLPSLTKGKDHKTLATLGYGAIGVLLIVYLTTSHMLALWIVIVPTTALLGLGYANLLPMFSEIVSEERQGWIMGVTGSVVALTAGIDSILSGFLANSYLLAPFILAITCIATGIIIIACYKHKPLTNTPH